MAHKQPRRTAPLARDTTGAILVVGLAMAILMVGALWHIVSVGDAILWREHVQDAADVAAFEVAVWNARGMNAIVFLNLTMAAAMAILLVLKATEMLLSTLSTMLYAALVGCFLPTPVTAVLCSFSAYARPVDHAADAVGNLYDTTEPTVTAFMKGLETAQAAVATATPLIGAKESATRVGSAYELTSVALSPSLVPTRVGSTDRLGAGVSLPVAQGETPELCEQAGGLVVHEMLAFARGQEGVPSGLVDRLGGMLEGLAESMAGSLSSVLCGSGGSVGSTPEADRQLGEVARQNCDAAKDNGRSESDDDLTGDERATLEKFDDYWSEDSSDPDADADGYVFDSEACESEQRRAAPGTQVRASAVTPARMWPDTRNGDFFMQAWGLVHLPPPHMDDADYATSIPDPASRRATWNLPIGTAQAEMYWDTSRGSGCDGDGSWDACEDETLWLMRWRARLRRLHDPSEMLDHSPLHGSLGGLGPALEGLSQVVSGLGDVAALEQFRRVIDGGLSFGAGPSGFSVGGAESGTVRMDLLRNPPSSSERIIH